MKSEQTSEYDRHEMFKGSEDRIKMLESPNMIDEVQYLFLGGVTVGYDPSITNPEDFTETIIELSLHSGCCDRVLDISDTSGYACVLGPSPDPSKGATSLSATLRDCPTKVRSS